MSEFITKLKLHNSNVLNIYLYGSRLWDNYNEESDYDLIIILKKSKKDKEGVHVENIDATLYSLEAFQVELANNKFLPVMTQISRDRSVILERHNFRFTLDRSKLQDSVIQEIARDQKLIEKFQQKQHADKAQKISHCCLRMCVFTLNILQGVHSLNDLSSALDAAVMEEVNLENLHLRIQQMST